ncbi:MAG: HAD-IIIA family hydrolase [Syntrophomonas sp.]|nr:HAD-IIIA family hydrolase [Syntrophomonas sp.]
MTDLENVKMNAVILAGGEGQRLKSLFPEIPKPLISIGGKPVLQYQIENLCRYGIRDIILVIGPKGDMIKEYFGDGSAFGVAITYFQEPSPLGTAGALFYLADNLTSDFVLLYGDLVLDVDFTRLLNYHRNQEALATLVVHPNDHPYDSDLIILENHTLVRGILGENDRSAGYYANCVNAGVFVFNIKILEYIEKNKQQDLEKNVLATAVTSNKIYGYRTTEYIKDMGTPERYRTVQRHICEGIVKEKNLSLPQKAIFLDRDGTINKYKGLISKTEDLEIIPQVFQALKHINDSSYLSIIITNQPVVARNLCSIEELETIHNRMESILGDRDVYVDDILYCPHHPDCGYPDENAEFKIECNCRKPKTGLIEQAAAQYNIDLSKSYIIGDSTVDVKTGAAAGLKSILLATGQGGTDGKFNIEPHFRADNLLQAVQIILSRGEIFNNIIETYIDELKETLDRLDRQNISLLINELINVHAQGGTVYIFGNGGSASTASHFAGDFNKGVSENLSQRFRFVCLNDNVPAILSIANDIGYEQVFKFQLENYLKPDDLVIAISGSGNSKNVILAIEYANSKGVKTFALTGYNGGQLKKIASNSMVVPVNDMQKVEDVHLMLNHLMMQIIKEWLEGDKQ